MDVVSLPDRPKSLRNRCVIEVSGGILVLSNTKYNENKFYKQIKIYKQNLFIIHNFYFLL